MSISLAESADSPSRADGQESKPSHSAKSKNTLNESLEKTSQEFGYSKTFGNFQQLNFASLSCLPEATRASLSVKPASAEARKMTATSGLRCLELSEHQGRLGYSLKMLLDTLRWASTKCLLTWKAKTTPCNRLLFQLAPWTPRTDEIESGFWATPRRGGMGDYADVMKTANYKFPNLETQVARSLLPTPIADDAKNVNPKENRFPTLTSKVKATEGSGALNPTWVEWLMGYPEGWTDLKDSETQSSLKSHTKSSKQ